MEPVNKAQNQVRGAQIPNIQAVGDNDLADLLGKAAAGERKRSHLLLHDGHDDQVQRLAIVLERGTYVRPHQHSEQWEMLALLRGRCDVLQFDPQGQLIGRVEMSAACPIVQIPVGTWHGCYVHENSTMLLEIKPGPYRPNEFADWAPPEGDPAVPRYLASLAR
jgi:cupin fold WbuC family metalloprotein